MRVLLLLLGLIMAATAIDIRFTTHYPWCGLTDPKRYSACVNVNPDSCGRGPGGSRSAYFAAVPEEWRIMKFLYSDQACKGEWVWTSTDAHVNCATIGPPLISERAKYSFKHFNGRSVGGEAAADQECQQVDTFVADGTVFDISHLDAQQIQYLHEAADNGTAEAVAQEFGLVQK